MFQKRLLLVRMIPLHLVLVGLSHCLLAQVAQPAEILNLQLVRGRTLQALSDLMQAIQILVEVAMSAYYQELARCQMEEMY